MATFTTAQVASGFPLRVQEKGEFTIAGEYTLTATLASGDIIQMLKIPDGVTVLQFDLVTTAFDDGATTALLFNVGDGADVNRFAESHTVKDYRNVRLGGDTLTKLGTLPYLYDLSDNDPDGYDTIDIRVIAYSGTGTATGTIKLIAHCTAKYP